MGRTKLLIATAVLLGAAALPAAAQRPTGSTLAQGRRPKATGDYKAWVPGPGN